MQQIWRWTDFFPAERPVFITVTQSGRQIHEIFTVSYALRLSRAALYCWRNIVTQVTHSQKYTYKTMTRDTIVYCTRWAYKANNKSWRNETNTCYVIMVDTDICFNLYKTYVANFYWQDWKLWFVEATTISTIAFYELWLHGVSVHCDRWIFSHNFRSQMYGRHERVDVDSIPRNGRMSEKNEYN